MQSEMSISNHSPGSQNVVTGSGLQYNFSGPGTQNNYYGCTQDLRAIEVPRLQEEKRRCLNSLSFRSMNSRRNNIDDAHPATCDWLFRTTEFEQWRHGDELPTHNGVLWIKGKPGAGKSTLMNYALSYCEKDFNDYLIAAHFFNARGEYIDTTSLGMMRSIIYQLVKKDSTLCEDFLKLFHEKQEQSRSLVEWQKPELKKFLRSIVKQPQRYPKPLLLFLDALDECVEQEVREVVSFLESLSLGAVHVGMRLRICLSSRHYPWISMKKTIELIVERRQEHGTDIATYIQEKLIIEDDSIQSQLRQKAGGIFMWVVLVVAMLNKAYDEGRHEAMQKTLDEIPEDLEGVFSTILGKEGPNRTEMINMLQWVLLSKRELTAEELYAAVVGEPLPPPKVIRRRINSSSRGLIEIRRSRGREIVQFIHLSVKDFLCRNKRLETLDPALQLDAISASHAYIWTRCWSYIQLQGTVSAGQADVRESRFLRYALSYIFYHADAALSNTTIARRLHHDVSHWIATHDAWLHLVTAVEDTSDREPFGYELGSLTSGDEKLIYIYTLVPYPNLFNLADKGADINATLSNGRTLLQCAIYIPSYEAVHLLIQNGVEVNGPGGRHRNLIRALSFERWDIAELLIENGVDLYAWDEDTGVDALQAASYYCKDRLDLVQLLIEKGIDVNTQGGLYGNALQAACYVGNYTIAELLLQKGADANAQGGLYGNALQAACVRGGYMIEPLLQKGADVNAQGGHYSSALQAACFNGNYTAAELLLQKGADVNEQGGRYGNALQAACCCRNFSSTVDFISIVELLMRWGADVNAQGGFYGHPLQAASSTGNEKKVKLLIEKGADVNALGGEYGDALHAAAYQDCGDVVRLLYANGAVHAQNLVWRYGGDLCERCEYRCVRWLRALSVSKLSRITDKLRVTTPC